MKQWQGILAKIWWGVVGLTLVGLAWLCRPYVSSAYHLHRGTQALVQENSPAAAAHLQKSLALEPKSVTAYRRLARAQLQQNRPELARQTMQQALHLAPQDPLVLLETGDVYDRLGDREQAIFYYEAGGKGDRKAKLAANYLQIAEQLWASGDEEAAVTVWRDKVRGTGYGDLYANWRLAQYFAGQEEAAQYQEAVRYFSLESVAPPPDHRLNEYQAQAILAVVEDGLWTRETLLNVVSYRVWQEQTKRTEALLKALTAAKADDADLRFYLGELYHRRGDWVQAKAAYRQAVELDPDYARAYSRLGFLTIIFCQVDEYVCNEQALKWYSQAYNLSRDDVLAAKKLISMSDDLASPNLDFLETEYSSKTNTRQIISEITGVSVHEINLGANLLGNGNFELWSAHTSDKLDTWMWYETDQGEYGRGLFLGGKDWLTLINNAGSGRIDGLWANTGNEKKTRRAGWRPRKEIKVDINKNRGYSLSFFYRTNSSIEYPLTVWTHPGSQNKLPNTNNEWRFHVIFLEDLADTATVRPLFYTSGAGQIWIGQIELRPVNLINASNTVK